MLTLVNRLLANEKVRYLIAGGATTFVNLVVFAVLRILTDTGRNLANLIAIIVAILFAYVVNKWFVFRSKKKTFAAAVEEFISFIGARILAMGVEILGVAILCDSFLMHEFVAKLFVQFIVIVVNYVFSKLFVFRDKKKSFTERVFENYAVWLSFLIVFVVSVIIFIVQKVWPIANHSLTLVDSVHQYLPFFAEFRDKLLHERSLFYTWNVALGSNFMGLSSYYLNSPFNFIFLLFPKRLIPGVASGIMLLKLALSAAFMAVLLTRHRNAKERAEGVPENRQNLLAVGLSVAYGLSNYAVGYYWNIMWFDCVMVLPLIILGFEKLVEEKDMKLYVLALAYALYCNYYIGFTICIFMVLWYLVYPYGKPVKWARGTLRFFMGSLLGGGLAAFALLPAYYGIMATAAGHMELPKHAWYGNIFALLKQFLFLTDPITNQIFDGGANLYCGMLAIITIFCYLFYKGDRIFVRIRRVLLVAFLLVSTNEELLNYIWHGFHNQYGIPNRFTYLLAFVLLYTAYDVLRDENAKGIVALIGAALASGFVVACKLIEKGNVTKLAFTASLLVIIVYGALMVVGNKGWMPKKAYRIAISAFCVVEIMTSAISGFCENGYATLGKAYTAEAQMREARREMKQLASAEGATFYRAELMNYDILDEATWQQLPSISTFNSTVLGNSVTVMGRLGFYTGANEFLYRGATPFTNSILGVRYLFKRKNDVDIYDFTPVAEKEGIEIHENPYPLSIAFAVDAHAKHWNREGNTPLIKQQELANMMTRLPYFFTLQYPTCYNTSDGMELAGDVMHPRVRAKKNGTCSFVTEFDIDVPGDYYINCRGNDVTEIAFSINGKSITQDRYQISIFHLGELAEGDHVTAELIYKNMDTHPEVAHFELATFDRNLYEATYRKLAAHQMNVTEFKDGYIEGTIEMPADATLFTSVPYDKGWKVYVDEHPAEYYAFGESFIGIDMEKGLHAVKMVYTPRGLYQGMLVSLLSAIFFGILLHEGKKKPKEKKPKIESQED